MSSSGGNFANHQQQQHDYPQSGEGKHGLQQKLMEKLNDPAVMGQAQKILKNVGMKKMLGGGF